MNKYGLYGNLRARPGKGKELSEILLQAAALMRNVEGCILYIVNREAGNLDSIWIMEVWESKDDHDNSLSLPGVRELIMQAMPILDETRIEGTAMEVLGGKGLEV